MSESVSSIRSGSLAVLAAVLVSTAACGNEAPTTPETPPSSFAAVKAVMAAPFDHTTVAKLNSAMGRDIDAPMAVVMSWQLSSELLWTVAEGTRDVAEVGRPAVSAYGPDPVCEFENGGSAEEWREYVDCAENAKGDCKHELLTSVDVDGDGIARVTIDGLHVHCK